MVPGARFAPFAPRISRSQWQHDVRFSLKGQYPAWAFAVTALRELVLQLRTTRGLPTPRKSYKATGIVGWVVGCKIDA